MFSNGPTKMAGAPHEAELNMPQQHLEGSSSIAPTSLALPQLLIQSPHKSQGFWVERYQKIK